MIDGDFTAQSIYGEANGLLYCLLIINLFVYLFIYLLYCFLFIY